MSKLAQGTHVFFIDPNDGTPAVVQVKGVTAFNPGGAPATQLDDTTLEDLVYMQYKAGLRNPGQASITINTDEVTEGHYRLHELSELPQSPNLKWAIGWSNGTEPPTLDIDGNFELPDTRTWTTYEGYVSDFPFDFATDALVNSQVQIQRSGGLGWKQKVVAP